MRIIVSGPPASGKTTLARHLAAIHSAEVVDLDTIAAELGSGDGHDHPEPVRTAALAETERRIDALTGDAVVIRSAPTVAERRALAERIGADHVIVLDVPAETAKARAAADDRPGWTAGAIDRWWSRYEPDGDTRSEQTLSTPGAAQLPEPTGPPAGAATHHPPADGRTAPAIPHGRQPMSDTPPTTPPAQPGPGDQPPPAATTPPPDPTPPAPADGDTDWKAEARKWETRAKENSTAAARLREIEDANKSELEKANERAAQAEDRAAKLELTNTRNEVAMAKGLTAAQARRLLGETREELEADADQLLAEFPGTKPADGAASPPAAGQQRPQESMGSVPLPGGDQIELDEPTDPRKLAERIRT